MKKFIRGIMISAIFISSFMLIPDHRANAQISAGISIQLFYDNLAPYGTWIDDPQYGYVWCPRASHGFRPYYTGGHWVMTRYGAMWASDFEWGWAPFHYGRWVYNSYYGWVWVPDTVWGPAWVQWRSGNDYCGWAPLGPGVNVSFSFGGYSVPNDWWVFVPERYCLSANFYNYRVPYERNVSYVSNTTIINNTYTDNRVVYAAGPRVTELERVTRSRVPVYNVADEGRPGRTNIHGNAVAIFKPQVSKSDGGVAKSGPRSFITRDQFMKTRTESGNRNQPTGNVNPAPVLKGVDRGSKQLERNQSFIERNRIQQNNNVKPVLPENNNPKNQHQIERNNLPKENNNPQSIPERQVFRNQHQNNNQNPRDQMQVDKKPVQQDNNNNKPVIPEQRIIKNQQQVESKHEQRSNFKQVIPQNQPMDQHPQDQKQMQMQKRDFQQPPNNNRQVIPERNNQRNQPPVQKSNSNPPPKKKGNN